MGMNERRYKIARPTAEGWNLVEQDDRGRFVWISNTTYKTRDEARAALRAMKTGGDEAKERAHEQEKRARENERKRTARGLAREVDRLKSSDLKMKDASPKAIAASMDIGAGVPRDVAIAQQLVDENPPSDGIREPVDVYSIASTYPPRPNPKDARRAARHARVRHTVASGRDA